MALEMMNPCSMGGGREEREKYIYMLMHVYAHIILYMPVLNRSNPRGLIYVSTCDLNPHVFLH